MLFCIQVLHGIDTVLDAKKAEADAMAASGKGATAAALRNEATVLEKKFKKKPPRSSRNALSQSKVLDLINKETDRANKCVVVSFVCQTLCHEIALQSAQTLLLLQRNGGDEGKRKPGGHCDRRTK